MSMNQLSWKQPLQKKVATSHSREVRSVSVVMSTLLWTMGLSTENVSEQHEIAWHAELELLPDPFPTTRIHAHISPTVTVTAISKVDATSLASADSMDPSASPLRWMTWTCWRTSHRTRSRADFRPGQATDVHVCLWRDLHIILFVISAGPEMDCGLVRRPSRG